MELFLSKLLPVFIYPVGAAISLSLLAWGLSLWGRRRMSLLCLVIGIGYLWAASTPVIAEFLYTSLEKRFPPMAIEDAPERDAIIVLGGAIRQPLPPKIEAEFNDAADRVLAAARLFRTARADKIIATGGSLPWMNVAEPEAVLIKQLLMEWGVPDQNILLDTESGNTHQNAIYTRTIMERHGLKNALLVTSAAHMPRAYALFTRAGMDVTPFPVDYRVETDGSYGLLDWLPDVEALFLTTLAVKEWLGMGYHRIRGTVY